MEKSVWLSYDLGVMGDYPGLYKWLDNKNAVECGKSVAFFNESVPDSTSDEQFLQILEKDIKDNVQVKPGNRFYIVWQRKGENGKRVMRGSFIMGKRMASPWEGYGDEKGAVNDDGIE